MIMIMIMIMIMMLVPIIVTLVGIVILVIGHNAYCKSLILVVPGGTVTDDNTFSVYRFIPVTEYVMSR